MAYLMQGNTDDSDVNPLQPIHGNGNTGDEYRKQMLVTLADELSNPDIQKEKDSAFTKYGKPAYYMNLILTFKKKKILPLPNTGNQPIT